MMCNGIGLFQCLVGGLKVNFIANNIPFKLKITWRGYLTSLGED